MTVIEAASYFQFLMLLEGHAHTHSQPCTADSCPIKRWKASPKWIRIGKAMRIHAVFFISNTVEFRLVLYLKVPIFLTSFVTYFVPYFSFKIFDSVGLILVSVLKSGG